MKKKSSCKKFMRFCCWNKEQKPHSPVMTTEIVKSSLTMYYSWLLLIFSKLGNVPHLQLQAWPPNTRSMKDVTWSSSYSQLPSWKIHWCQKLATNLVGNLDQSRYTNNDILQHRTLSCAGFSQVTSTGKQLLIVLTLELQKFLQLLWSEKLRDALIENLLNRLAVWNI